MTSNLKQILESSLTFNTILIENPKTIILDEKLIKLGKHNIRVRINNEIREIKYKDILKLLNLENDINIDYVDTSFLTDKLYEKIYITNNATKEQKVIYNGLCIVGINALIDEKFKVNLKTISYKNEFNRYLKREKR